MDTINPSLGLFDGAPIVTRVMAIASVRYPHLFVAPLSPCDPIAVSGPGDASGWLFDALVAAADELLGEDGWDFHGESRSAVVLELAWWAMDLAKALATVQAFVCSRLLALPYLGLSSAADPLAAPSLSYLTPLTGAGSTLSPPLALHELNPVEARAA